MTWEVRFTEEARDDLERLYRHALERDGNDLRFVERALDALRRAVDLLAVSPFIGRCLRSDTIFLRELVISYGASGLVAMFEIDDATSVTVLAVRHQRESDYH